MLRNVWYELTCFDRKDKRKETEKDLVWLMEALVQRNQDYLARRPNTPRLYKSGVVWSAPKQLDGDCEEVKILRDALGPKVTDRDVQRALDKVQDVLGGEHFCDIGVILELGDIDCDGLACWRVAELRQMGIPAKPFMTSRERLGGTTYHALVIWPPMIGAPYETSEDPSLLLGMHQPERASDRTIEIQKNIERGDILRRHGKNAVLRSGATDNTLSSPGYDGASLDAAMVELTGGGGPPRIPRMRRRAA